MVAQASMEDLYGAGKAYPEPYAAGKCRRSWYTRDTRPGTSKQFVFSVRYRSGPWASHSTTESAIKLSWSA